MSSSGAVPQTGLRTRPSSQGKAFPKANLAEAAFVGDDVAPPAAEETEEADDDDDDDEAEPAVSRQASQPTSRQPAGVGTASQLNGVQLLSNLQTTKGMPWSDRITKAKRGLSAKCQGLVDTVSTTNKRQGYYSQFFQDAFLHLNFYLDNPKNGMFLDVGANEPITGSNSYFFEECLGWKGLMFEGHPDYIKQLRRSRSMTLVPNCASDHEQDIDMVSNGVCTYLTEANQLQKSRAGTGKALKAHCRKIGDVLREQKVSHVDVMSLDIEGSEIWALEGIYWDEVTIDFIVAENNFGDDLVRSFLMPRGYVQIAQLWPDEVFMYMGHTAPVLAGSNDKYNLGAADYISWTRLDYAKNVIDDGKMPKKTPMPKLREKRQQRRKANGFTNGHSN